MNGFTTFGIFKQALVSILAIRCQKLIEKSQKKLAYVLTSQYLLAQNANFDNIPTLGNKNIYFYV